MASFRDKITPFTFGLSIGLLAACLFFIFKLDTYIRKIDLSNLTQKQQVTEEVVAPPEKNRAKEKKDTKATRRQEAPEEKKSGNSSFPAHALADSVHAETEAYKVLTEELQSVRNIYVKVLPKEKAGPKDSLIATLAGVNLPDDKEFFMIEFWKSPLNSKGYKMTRSRLIIYGFSEGKDLQLVKEADRYYLRNNNVIYMLSYSAEFRPLERATDVAALTKFN